MFYEKLIEIGFTDGEAKIYLELLKIGPQAAGTIAKRLDMNRTTVYSLVRSLEMKGVLGSYKNGKVKIYAANDPNCLVGYLDRKCKVFDYYRSELLSIIPEFRGVFQGQEFKKPVVSYYEGREAVDQIIDEALSFSGEMYICLKDKSGNITLSRSMKSELDEFKHVISVYKDKISILNKGRGSEYAVVIQSKEIADIHKIIFNVARNGFNIKSNES
jgi:sugar-specific transcriptional regulator TrmB